MTQKEKAVECLQELDVFCTDLFVEKNKVAVFHSYLGEALSTYPGLREKIAEVEKRSGCLVYAVTHEYFSFGECFSFLVVSKYEEDWQYSLRRFASHKRRRAGAGNQDGKKTGKKGIDLAAGKRNAPDPVGKRIPDIHHIKQHQKNDKENNNHHNHKQRRL